ncbi:Cytokine receptor-like protein [Operophtera brumata]|uniref:Cytokine receptor-like protein n=1 Tax=Operophtera brumata TaxID=104452 RepID=A0A0L7LKT3_OPEBR|nr:Cytokine receptor-like protein [Operophtera brumata]
MAIITNNTLNRKCSLPSAPQFRLWFWCITIQWLIALPCIFSRCLGVELSLAVHPEGMINVPYGQPLEILCSDDKYTAENLQFEIGGTPIPSNKLNTTTRRLSMENHKKGVFTYYCRNTVTNKVCASRVLVDSAPLDVTDFACKSQNLDVLNCTWSNPESFSITNYTFTSLGFNSVDVCTTEKIGKTRYCAWNTSGQPRYRQQEKEFVFYLTFCNVFGCNEQNFTINHFAIVKPDPPKNLKVLGNGTHCVLLHWSIPNNMFDFLPNGVDHKIEYQIAKIDNTSYFRTVDTSGLPAKNKTYKFQLSDLPYAHMQYEVRIYIRPKEAVKDEFWSDFTYLVFYTASERPHRPPDTVVGAFEQSSFVTTRRIYVYWKQLEEYEEAGANFTYKVVTHQGTENPKTLLADNKKSLSYIVLDNASLGAISVEIWSINDKGSSLNKSHLYIPPKTDTLALRVPSFTKLGYENGTYKLSWVSINNVDNYTVFWCQHNTTKICSGRMNFTVLEANKTNHVIDLPRENRYQFAISANVGTKTSGMVWATCDISKDGIPMYGFPVELHHDIPGKSFVTITWTMACTLQEGIITGYNITYCPVINTSNVCDTSFTNSSVYVSDPKQMEINITDLKPYRTYQFAIALNTIYGLKTIDNASTGVTTTEDTPTSPRNVSITEVESNSIVISWDPPLEKNGIIGKYVIYNYSEEYTFDKVPHNNSDSVLRRSFKIEGLHGFSNYSWSVVACNTAIRSCSQKSPPNGIFHRTRIGPPSKLKKPTIFYNPDVIKWEKPVTPGGTVNLYQLLRVKDKKPGEILNTTNLSYSLLYCEGTVAVEKYQVRAVNFDKDLNHGVLSATDVGLPKSKQEYPGEWSDSTLLACGSEHGTSLIFILTAVFALAACVVVVVYELIKCYKIRKT